MVQKIWRKAKVEWVCQIGRHYICTILKSGIEDGQNVPQYIYSDKSDLFSVIKVFLSAFTVATPTWWILSRGNKVFGVYLQWQTWFVLRASKVFLGVFTVTNLICPEGQHSILGCIYSDKPDLSWGPTKHFWVYLQWQTWLVLRTIKVFCSQTQFVLRTMVCFLVCVQWQTWFVPRASNQRALWYQWQAWFVQRDVRVFLGCICTYSDKPDCPEGCQGVLWVYLHLH